MVWERALSGTQVQDAAPEQGDPRPRPTQTSRPGGPESVVIATSHGTWRAVAEVSAGWTSSLWEPSATTPATVIPPYAVIERGCKGQPGQVGVEQAGSRWAHPVPGQGRGCGRPSDQQEVHQGLGGHRDKRPEAPQDTSVCTPAALGIRILSSPTPASRGPAMPSHPQPQFPCL